jgi:hypothetical protein
MLSPTARKGDEEEDVPVPKEELRMSFCVSPVVSVAIAGASSRRGPSIM